jgi:hypothetical protein
MIIQVEKTGTLDGFKTLLDEMSGNEKVKGLLILTCDENGFTQDSIDDSLKRVSIPLFGGIFPGIIHGREKLNKGTIMVGLTQKPDVHIIPNLSDTNIDYETIMEDLTSKSSEGKTMFVFVDGYSRRINSLIENLYTRFGLRYNFIGGGAGSINPSALDMSNTPCLFTNNGLIKDSALLTVVDIESSVAAGHGWYNKISGPYKVTESSGNAVQSLDWKPAFEVYKKAIKEHCEETITDTNFFDIAKRFPFGISRLESEIIVRDPFTVEGESLIVATEIPQESFVDILTGNPDSIVNAARQSYLDAQKAFHSEETKTVFVIDCISRALFLGDDFEQEIEAVNQGNVALIGAMALGEVANSGKDYMELYNKTCVVGILGE